MPPQHVDIQSLHAQCLTAQQARSRQEATAQLLAYKLACPLRCKMECLSSENLLNGDPFGVSTTLPVE